MCAQDQQLDTTTSVRNCEDATVFIDTHVHIYPCYDPEQFFRAAFNNLTALARGEGLQRPPEFVLCITEQPKLTEFARLQERVGSMVGEYAVASAGRGWVRVSASQTGTEANLWLIHGAQYRAAEGFEVLSPLISDVAKDGQSARDIINQVLERQEPVVLPWSLGKWWGPRGEALRGLLENLQSSERLVFLGDIPMRRFGGELGRNYFGLPSVFGSDPLPWREEVRVVGSFASKGRGEWSNERPLESVREILLQEALQGVGRRNSMPRALYRLIRVNLVSRF